jgi:hypothetical protein
MEIVYMGVYKRNYIASVDYRVFLMICYVNLECIEA